MSSSFGNTYLVLLARYSPVFVEQKLIPEIEKNCEQFGICYPTAYDTFQKNKFAAKKQVGMIKSGKRKDEAVKI